jgi:hypothetical protein
MNTEHHMTRIRSLIEIEMNKLLVSIQTHNISSLLLLASDVHDAKKTVLAHKWLFCTQRTKSLDPVQKLVQFEKVEKQGEAHLFLSIAMSSKRGYTCKKPPRRHGSSEPGSIIIIRKYSLRFFKYKIF